MRPLWEALQAIVMVLIFITVGLAWARCEEAKKPVHIGLGEHHGDTLSTK